MNNIKPYEAEPLGTKFKSGQGELAQLKKQIQLAHAALDMYGIAPSNNLRDRIARLAQRQSDYAAWGMDKMQERHAALKIAKQAIQFKFPVTR
jgi:hypothetical protein